MGHSTGLEEIYTDMKDEQWLEHYKVCAIDLMISDHQRLREKNNRLESEKKEHGTIKQQISRAIEEDRRGKDSDLVDMVRDSVRAEILNLSSISKKELLAELKKRR